MAVNYIQTDTVMMKRTISDMQTEIRNLQALADEVYSEMQELDMMWDGSANKAFNIQFNNDRTRLLEICNNIQKYINNMDSARNEYDMCENRVEDIVRTIRI